MPPWLPRRFRSVRRIPIDSLQWDMERGRSARAAKAFTLGNIGAQAGRAGLDRDLPRRRQSTRGRLAGRIPDRTVRDVVEQTDMIAVVGEVVELRRAGTSWKGLCPFHNEKSPSFHVNPGLKLYHCYGCGAGGDLIRFVRETRGLSFVEAVEHLAERTGVRIEREHFTLEQQQKLDAERSVRGRMLDLARCAQAFFRERFDRPEGREAHDYAAARGLGPEITERFGLGAAGTGWTDLAQHLHKHGFQDGEIVAIGLGVQRDSGGLYDRFRNRLMYPIPNAAGDIVGFGGRHLGEDKDVAKYMNSPETTLAGEDEASRFYHFYKKGQVVFGLFQARSRSRPGAAS
jgi:DNA primase